MLAWGLSRTTANAASVYVHFKNRATGHCLDYRADYGPCATGCNGSGYQTWVVNNTAFELSAMRQNAGDRLCLVARNGQATMKPCSSSDADARRLVKLVPCSGGNSQQWEMQT
ncbi:ricin-type beta-trefoil lectin domain protein [Streptomyces sp. NPDC050095]|uniref:ricin-type beta-trefoil lectin domain protein n=1 Tax=unclassified Streptomyces TaxID=2593676 RepID=UPI00343DF6A6